ncbi:MAG: hypothetical protein IMZ57_04780 [Acidobacteria bacterium]|nr:hypothetical protein [Candidatus Atribacteria bacterium]MBE3124957.1 hypothetical protein [Acidobacteriota bacterium]
MRTLLYVPIIHTSADLGSLAEEVERRGLKKIGENMWRDHLRTIDGLWDALFLYFDSIHVSGAKIFQDGMIADGDVGLNIIQEGEKAGSKNHQLVSKLLHRGALLMKTENFNLVKKERDRLLKMIRAKTTVEKLFGLILYKLTKKTLLRQRDEYIAQRIDQALKEGETGILFIGAYHHIKPRLPHDIHIKEIKDTRKIKDYQSLLPFYPKNKKRFEDLSGYLISKIDEGDS